jgi:alanyl aminopeptidase
MLGALSHAQGAEADVARDFALSPQVKVGEMAMILRGGRDTVAQRVENYFKPKLGQEEAGLKRGLAQTHESIVLCSALKAHQNTASIAP